MIYIIFGLAIVIIILVMILIRVMDLSVIILLYNNNGDLNEVIAGSESIWKNRKRTWINVNEQLPEVRLRVYLWDGLIALEGYLDFDNKFKPTYKEDLEQFNHDYIIAWHPIPNSPLHEK